MNIDLTKLTPAPWTAHPNLLIGGWGVYPPGEALGEGREAADFADETHARFIELARSAFDVMMRRGWHPYQNGGPWCVRDFYGSPIGAPTVIEADDPFTALVEADRWYIEVCGGPHDSRKP